MRAVKFDEFGGPLSVAMVEDPTPSADAAIIEVRASGICRSDWHGWQGHDPDIVSFPHVPGHELAGLVAAVGDQVTRWSGGERVTSPFVCGCGACPTCEAGDHHICDRQTQPGFTHWGSFAEFVVIRNADINLVALPDEVEFVTAASLGCRFATSYRAVVLQGAVEAGDWVAVHGCGGVGLSAVMIASAIGARVVAIDVDAGALSLAGAIGAEVMIDASSIDDVPGAIRDATEGGAQVSLDALGSRVTCRDSILGLAKRGRHVQVGLLVGDDHRPPVPMEHVIARELEIMGSHGMQASYYPEMLEQIVSGELTPDRIVDRRVSLDEVPGELEGMGEFAGRGIAVIDRI